jgi:tRNA (guanine-N7-)-methyltransferase
MSLGLVFLIFQFYTKNMEKQEIRSFGRVHGKRLSARQQWLADNLLPELSPDKCDLDILSKSVLILEIGFGSGEHLLRLAKENPDSLVIGAEPFMNGVASLLSQISADEIGENKKEIVKPEYGNIRVWPDDVRKLLFRPLFSSLRFSKIYILHPDPWPKKRHEKRRLLCSEFLNLLAERLKPGGKIIIGTDHLEYYDWIVLQAKRSKLQIAELQSDKIIETRYQRKNKFGGARPMYLELCNI